MNIFWLCNVEPPIISEHRNVDPIPFGGWLDESSRYVAHNNNLTICYYSDTDQKGSFDNVSYYGFKEENAVIILKEILSSNRYDVYHIWGTEYNHSLECVNLLETYGELDKCLINVQGLVSVIANHYADGVPQNVISKRTYREYFRKENIADQVDSFRNAGYREIEILKKVKFVIGRTEWDRACIQEINPDIRYFKCNENLRSCFYGAKWDISKAVRHTVFVSQCNYPVKGMHYLLPAIKIVKDVFPDVRIVTTGRDLLSVSKRGLLTLSSYAKYLIDLINEYELRDNIEFVGMLSAEEMLQRYLGSNVFVSPSTIENSSNSIGEAMLVGCPVVASYVGGTPSLIDNGVDGFLYQVNSKEMLAYSIIRIFQDDELAHKISDSERIRAAQTHDIRTNNNRMTEIYRLLVNHTF